MSQIMKSHLAVLGLGVLAAVTSSNRVTAMPSGNGGSIVSPASRQIQLAAGPKVERRDDSKPEKRENTKIEDNKKPVMEEIKSNAGGKKAIGVELNTDTGANKPLAVKVIKLDARGKKATDVELNTDSNKPAKVLVIKSDTGGKKSVLVKSAPDSKNPIVDVKSNNSGGKKAIEIKSVPDLKIPVPTVVTPVPIGVEVVKQPVLAPTTTISPGAKLIMVTVKDPKYGALQVTSEQADLYARLPLRLQRQLGDPQGGLAVNTAVLRYAVQNGRFPAQPLQASTPGLTPMQQIQQGERKEQAAGFDAQAFDQLVQALPLNQYVNLVCAGNPNFTITVDFTDPSSAAAATCAKYAACRDGTYKPGVHDYVSDAIPNQPRQYTVSDISCTDITHAFQQNMDGDQNAYQSAAAFCATYTSGTAPDACVSLQSCGPSPLTSASACGYDQLGNIEIKIGQLKQNAIVAQYCTNNPGDQDCQAAALWCSLNPSTPECQNGDMVTAANDEESVQNPDYTPVAFYSLFPDLYPDYGVGAAAFGW